MDPIHNPAFSPSWSAEAISTYASIDVMSTALHPVAPRTAAPAKAIPPKFLVTAKKVNHHPTQAAHTSYQDDRAITTMFTTASTARFMTAQGHIITSQLPPPGADLPPPPMWVIHLLAGSLSFLIVMAVVLLLAQFPPRPSWLSTSPFWRRFRYTNINREDDHELIKAASFYGRSSAVATDNDNVEMVEDVAFETFRKRRPKHLTIDARAEYRGLGIAVPGCDNVMKTARERQSFDEEAQRVRRKSPVVGVWEAFTAPLPSVRMFGPGSGNAGIGGHHSAPIPHVEDSAWSNESSDAGWVTDEQPDSGGSEAGTESQESGILGKINDGIERVADKMANAFYDSFVEPEQGLLLPVHDEEREKALVPGMFVD